MYFVDIDTRTLFYNAHIKPHIDYVSVVWDGCSDVLKKILNWGDEGSGGGGGGVAVREGVRGAGGRGLYPDSGCCTSV